MPEHRFSAIESLLLSPAASGVIVTTLRGESAHGLEVGDIITGVNGQPVSDQRSYLEAIRPGEGEEPGPLEVSLVRRGGTVSLELPPPPHGISITGVCADQPAWSDAPESDYEPDFSVLQSHEIWMRSSFETTPAGFEYLRVERDGDELRHDYRFRIGGVEPTWDYHTRGHSRHRLDRTLSVIETAHWEGHDGQEPSHGHVTLRDGRWRGSKQGPDGETPVDFDPGVAAQITGYSMPMLTLTLPLEEGASLLVVTSGDGAAVPGGRTRIACLGRRSCTVNGAEREAWCYTWRGYGAKPEADCEHLYVSDDRELLRIDWGPDYGGCWCELVDGPDALGPLPPHVSLRWEDG